MKIEGYILQTESDTSAILNRFASEVLRIEKGRSEGHFIGEL